MGFLDLFRCRTAPDKVVITKDAIIRTRPDGVQETVTWSDLTEVGILTTDEGPLQEDVFWILLGSGGSTGCCVPQSSEGADKLLGSFERLPASNMTW